MKTFFNSIHFSSPQEALMQVFKFMLEEGRHSNYPTRYIWEKDRSYFIEGPCLYHKADLWRSNGYKVFDIIRLFNFSDQNIEKNSNSTGFIFNASLYYPDTSYFKKDAKNKKNVIIAASNEEIHLQEEKHYGAFAGTYAQDVMGYDDDTINDAFEGDPDAYWNID